MLDAEEARERFAAVASDLKLALSGLQAVGGAAPADVAEDVAAVQRQLAALRFSSSTRQEQLAWQLLEVRWAARPVGTGPPARGRPHGAARPRALPCTHAAWCLA